MVKAIFRGSVRTIEFFTSQTLIKRQINIHNLIEFYNLMSTDNPLVPLKPIHNYTRVIITSDDRSRPYF